MLDAVYIEILLAKGMERADALRMYEHDMVDSARYGFTVMLAWMDSECHIARPRKQNPNQTLFKHTKN
jgi:hypothetical protein